MNMSGLKNILVKGGLGMIAISLVCGIAWLIFSWADHRATDAINAARNAGYAQATADTANGTNAQLLANMKVLQQMETDTSNKLNNIQTVATREHKEIDSFNVTQIAVDHPEEVEAWANKTTGDIFTGIAVSTASPTATPAPLTLSLEPPVAKK